jgi:crossover junction endodeoxyribonuclease RusA
VVIPVTSPLSMNARDHWAVKAKKVAVIRDSVAWMARAERIPALDKIGVTLFYIPKVPRIRDADNLVATLKPACDGLVDAGVVPDDVPEFMVKSMPVILPIEAECKQRVYLMVYEL